MQRKFLEERERADQLENKLLQLIQAIKKERENQKAKEIEQVSNINIRTLIMQVMVTDTASIFGNGKIFSVL